MSEHAVDHNLFRRVWECDGCHDTIHLSFGSEYRCEWLLVYAYPEGEQGRRQDMHFCSIECMYRWSKRQLQAGEESPHLMRPRYWPKSPGRFLDE